MLCLGLDSGTTACKGVVIDADSGKIFAQARAPHPFVEDLPQGHVEQESQTWCDGAEQVTLVCLENRSASSEIMAFGASAQQYRLVTLDDRKTCAAPGKENRMFYAELRGRYAGVTRKLASNGYL